MPDNGHGRWSGTAFQQNTSQKVNGHARGHKFEIIPDHKLIVSAARKYVIKGLIPNAGLVVIWGPPKCGKSFSAYDLAMHIALGWSWRGCKVVQRPVVYIACEGESGIPARREAWRRHYLTENADAIPFYWLLGRVSLPADHAALINDIRDAIGDIERPVIFIDTVNRSYEGSESNDEDMTAYIRACDALIQAFDAVVVLIHHCGIDQRRPRGHTSLAGAVDAQVACVKQDSVVNLKLEWAKDSPDGAEFNNRLEAVEVGTDEDGDPIVSCVAVQAAAGETAHREERPKRVNAAGRVVLTALQKALEAEGGVAPPHNHIPRNVKVAPLDLWRRYAYEMQISDGDTQQAKKKAFKRGVESLQAAGVVGVWGEFAWISSN